MNWRQSASTHPRRRQLVHDPAGARYTFLDPRAPQFLRDWDKAADDTVAILRAEAGRDPYDRLD